MKVKIVLASSEPEYYQVGQTWFIDRKMYTVTFQFKFWIFRYVVMRYKNLNRFLKKHPSGSSKRLVTVTTLPWERVENKDLITKASDLKVFKK